MFGHDNKDDNQNDDSNVIHPISTKPADEKLVGVAEQSAIPEKEAKEDVDDDIAKIVGDINASTDATEKPEISPSSASVTKADPGSNSDASDDNQSEDQEVTSSEKPEPSPEPVVSSPPSEKTHDKPTGELQDIKKSALQELSPIIDQLDQSPEEKTNTLLMMIQATDDKNLISDAFSSAKDIKDEKKRAQAMLDIINEINYFTTKNK